MSYLLTAMPGRSMWMVSGPMAMAMRVQSALVNMRGLRVKLTPHSRWFSKCQNMWCEDEKSYQDGRESCRCKKASRGCGSAKRKWSNCMISRFVISFPRWGAKSWWIMSWTTVWSGRVRSNCCCWWYINLHDTLVLHNGVIQKSSIPRLFISFLFYSFISSSQEKDPVQFSF